MSRYLLGVDSGGTVTKAVLYDLAGREIAAGSAGSRASTPQPRWVERDMTEAWMACADAIRQAISGVDPADIAGLGLTGHNDGIYLVDADLRPEGRNGPLARSLDAYAEYYRRWALSWEAQALLRARGVAGSTKLIGDFMQLADQVRYPDSIDPAAVREIKRIKARVESERLPQGVDPSRHLKLGPGSLSDVEWLVQLLQLQHAHAVPAMRTTSTLGALRAAEEAGLLPSSAADRLAEAWRLASRLRSANTLLSGQTSDVLPVDRKKLDGIGRLLEYPPRSATQVEEDYLGTTRRARRVFSKLFYG